MKRILLLLGVGAALGLTGPGMAHATERAAAPADGCGSTLRSWTGPDDKADYQGFTGTASAPKKTTHSIVFNHGSVRVSSRWKGSGGGSFGTYGAASVKSGVFEFTGRRPPIADAPRQPTAIYRLTKPTCDASGNVTSALLSAAVVDSLDEASDPLGSPKESGQVHRSAAPRSNDQAALG